MSLPFAFDFKNPNYLDVFDLRVERLNTIRENPECLPVLKDYYRENIHDFITDWGCTADPRNIEIGLPVVMPFVLFPEQENWINFTYENWKKREFCVTAKSRDMGVTWLAVAFSVGMCVLNDNMTIGFGSYKEESVDRIGSPKSIFFKIRQFVSLLPPEFKGSWDIKKHAPYMRTLFPDTESRIVGEAGQNIGRGDRTSLYFVDEAGHLQQPDAVDAALSNTTNCRHDISTPKGPNNPFARKCQSGKMPYFAFHWTKDPRKDIEWYKKMERMIDNDVILAQEVNIDFNASVEGVIIPQEMVLAAIDAHKKLGFAASGYRRAGMDVADGGGDANVYIGVHGSIVEYLEKWSGRDQPDRIFGTVKKAMALSIALGYDSVEYDADGLGASVRGDAYTINKEQKEQALKNNEKPYEIEFLPFFGQGEVVDKEKYPSRYAGEIVNRTRDHTNGEIFENAKAQGWYTLQHRFKKTYRAIKEREQYEEVKKNAEKEGVAFNEPIPTYNINDMISISSDIKDYWLLVTELSQPVFVYSGNGKLMVDKKPDGARSPNCADALMIAFAPKKNRRSFFDVRIQ